MRHGRLATRLGRQSAHRKATVKNLCRALLIRGRITTTVAKAKACRKAAEKLITKGKKNTLHSQRLVYSILGDRDLVKLLFKEIAPLFSARNGGYTRIIKLAGFRRGDSAEMAILELTEQRAIAKKEKPKKEKAQKPKKEEAPKFEAVPELAEVVEEKIEETAQPAKKKEPHIEKKEEVKLKEKPKIEEKFKKEEKHERKEPRREEKPKGLFGGFKNLFKRQDKSK